MSAPTYVASDDDVAFYREHGYWISPVILSDEQLALLNYGAERYYAGERDAHLLAELNTDWSPERGDVLRQNDYVSLQLDEFRAFLEDPTIARLAARLAGTREVRLFHDQLIYKPGRVDPRHSTVGWHTDRAYWATCTSLDMITAWIPLQTCTPDMGPMVVLDASHRWEGHDQLKRFHQPDLAAIDALIDSRGRERREVAMTLRAGQVSFHHCRTIHGSYPNTSSTPRLALAVHMQDRDNRYCAAHDAAGKPIIHINDILCRRDAGGRPDYRDPVVCPVLYREEDPA